MVSKKLFQVTSMFLIAASIGCSSALKKECESKNWFEHGKSVAMSGKRLNEDSFVKSCEKEGVEVNSAQVDLGFKAGMSQYCLPDTVFQTGKNGDFFNTDLCDPSHERSLKARHAEGVVAFCDPSNGQSVGSSGRVYNKICPTNMEQKFLKEFNKGRKIYLSNAMSGKEQEILQIEQQIHSYESEKNRLTMEMATMPSGEIITQESVYDPVTNSYKQQFKKTQDATAQQKRDNLKYEISNMNRNIEASRAKQLGLRQEITKLKTEKETLDNN